VREEGGGSGGTIKWKLSEVNTRAVSRGQNEYNGNHIIPLWCGPLVTGKVQLTRVASLGNFKL
jgi:hypothetical protein